MRTKRVRKQKTYRQDAQLLLRLLLEDRFPRIWVPVAENRDLRQLGRCPRRSRAETGTAGPHQQAGQRAVALPEWRSQFFHLAMRRGRKIAKVAMARKLAVELYWMWRRGWNYDEMQQLGSRLAWQISTRAKWRSSRSGRRRVLENVLTPPTLLEMGIFRQLTLGQFTKDTKSDTPSELICTECLTPWAGLRCCCDQTLWRRSSNLLPAHSTAAHNARIRRVVIS